MLTEGPAPDPKCKLNISFLTLPHLSDCLIYTSNYMSIVLLLQMVGRGREKRKEREGGRGDGIGERWFIFNRVWEEGQRVGIIF